MSDKEAFIQWQKDLKEKRLKLVNDIAKLNSLVQILEDVEKVDYESYTQEKNNELQEKCDSVMNSLEVVEIFG